MPHLLRTTSENKDFIKLVSMLDAELAVTDGEDHLFYNQFNKIDSIKFVVVTYANELPQGCGAIKEYNSTTMEIKRMYVAPEHRGKGIATQILLELEHWATELLFERCMLETGKRQTEALQLYKKNGYIVIPNYGQYAGIENSVCFEKNNRKINLGSNHARCIPTFSEKPVYHFSQILLRLPVSP